MPDGFIEKLSSFNRVLLTPHEQPDADAIGSTLGLAWHLHGAGKEFKLVVSPKLPSFLEFLDVKGWIECYSPSVHEGIAEWADCWVLADANEADRMGPLKDQFSSFNAKKFCIDHHLPDSPDGQGHGLDAFDRVLSDPEASSTCELVLQAIGIGPHMPLPMARALYAGMMDDTGSFRFPCTSPKVHKMAAALLEIGVRPDEAYRGLYHQGTAAKMRISGIAFEQMQLYCNERLAVMAVTSDDMKSVGAIHEDLEGLVNKPLELKTVEVSALAYHRPDGRVKVSLRSKSLVDANTICRSFGGGGHRLASGATLSGTMAEALDKLVPAITARLEQDLDQ